MSTVYRRQGDDGPEVVKVLAIERPTASELLRFHNELQISAALEVDGVRRARHKELFQGRHALVLDYVPGEHLRLSPPDQPREVARRLEVCARVADILADLHDAGVIHCDIKPANLLYDPATGQLCLIDLGSASRVAVRTTHLGNPTRLEGTLAYLSPEQTGRMARVIDHRTDLYSFGVTLFETLTGKRPFTSSDPLELIHGHLARVPPRVDDVNPQVPSRVADIVARLLEKDAEDRYGAARLLAADLRACAGVLAAGGDVEAVPLSHDTRATFSVPERLYGRQAQSAALVAAASRAADGHAEVATVGGPSGTGKSHLVRQLQRDLAGRHGLFLAGKFDRLQRDIPYYAAIEAFQGLVEQVLTYDEEELDRWRTRLGNAVGDLGAAVTSVVPALELVLGPQPDIPELGSQETRARLQYVFRRFVAALCAPEHPVVFFLDDVQWADRASLDLIADVLVDPGARHLLVVLAFRDDEVDAAHPVTELLATLDTAGVRHTALTVGPLSPSDLAKLATDTTGRDGERVAKLLADKTGGNPFFARQYLSFLHARGLFSLVHGTWVLAEDGLDELDITDNVARLLAANLRGLPESTYKRLCTAACLGHRFELPMLADVENLPVQQVAEALWPAVSAGHLIAEEDAFRLVHADADADAYEGAALSFVHDRVQSAAYQTVDKAERPAVHRRVGEVLRRTRPDAVFDIAHHLNLAAESGAGACPELPALNLAAGRRAAASAAHDEALRYFEAGLARLGEDAWTHAYDLTRDLHTEAARAALEANANERVSEFAAPVLERGHSPLERVRALRSCMMAAVAVNDLPRALQMGLDALAELGEHFPKRPAGPHIGLALARVKLGLWGTDPASLAERPPMESVEKQEAMWVLEKLLPTAFRLGSDHFPLIVLRLVQLSLTHGNSPVSSFAYAGYAIMLCGILGDYEGGERFGKLAISLSERHPEHLNLRSKALFVHSNMVRHWRHPLRDGIDDLALATRLGSEAGSTFDAVWSALYRVMWLFITGAELTEVALAIDDVDGLLRRDESARDEARLLRQLVTNLTDETTSEPWVLTGEFCEESEIEAALTHTGDGTDAVIHWLCRGWMALLFGHHAAAVDAFERAEAQFDAVVGLPFVPIIETYSAVARCALATEGDASGLRRAAKSARKLRRWSKSGPANYAHRHAWVEAELAAARNQAGPAREHYGRAATLAREHGWSQDEAQILERAAGFEHRVGHQVVAEALAERASVVYRAWGAQTKLVRGSTLVGSPTLLTDTRASSHSSSHTTGVDMQSIMKASAAITSILVLDQLLVRLVEILVENAGATHGAVVLARDGQWFVEVSLGVSEDADLDAQPLDVSSRTCRAAVRFAARSSRSLTVADAQVDDRFHHDRRVTDKSVRSMLAVPVVKAGRVTGVVYAENHHVAGAFTEERLAVLELLAAQAAIALDNARLYENLNTSLERQVALTQAHGRFVPQAFLDNLGAASITDVALGDAVEKDMAVLFSDIRGFTPLIEGLGARGSIRFINGYLEFMEPPIHAHGGFVDSYIGDAIMALFEGGTEGAVWAALGMLEGLHALNTRRDAQGMDPIRMGIGISYGRVMLGTIGGPNRLKCGVIGDPVNLGARVESLTKAYRVSLLVTDQVLAMLPEDRVPAHRLADKVVVKGRNEGVALYELYSADAPTRRQAKERAKEAHERGVAAFYDQRFAEASEAFVAALGELGEDVIVERFLQRADALRHMDLPPDWDGVERLTFK